VAGSTTNERNIDDPSRQAARDLMMAHQFGAATEVPDEIRDLDFGDDPDETYETDQNTVNKILENAKREFAEEEAKAGFHEPTETPEEIRAKAVSEDHFIPGTYKHAHGGKNIEESVAREVRALGENTENFSVNSPAKAPNSIFRNPEYVEQDEIRVEKLVSEGRMEDIGHIPITRDTPETARRDMSYEVENHGVNGEELKGFDAQTLAEVDRALDTGVIGPEQAIEMAQWSTSFDQFEQDAPTDFLGALTSATKSVLQDGQEWKTVEPGEYSAFPEGAAYVQTASPEQRDALVNSFESSGVLSIDGKLAGKGAFIVPNDSLNEMREADFSQVEYLIEQTLPEPESSGPVAPAPDDDDPAAEMTTQAPKL